MTKTQTRKVLEAMITAKETPQLISLYYTNTEMLKDKRGTQEYGAHMLVHMLISDEITDRLGEATILHMEDVAFGEIIEQVGA